MFVPLALSSNGSGTVAVAHGLETGLLGWLHYMPGARETRLGNKEPSQLRSHTHTPKPRLEDPSIDQLMTMRVMEPIEPATRIFPKVRPGH